MKNINPITIELIAPCGMNCAVCSRYLAHVNNLKRSQCPGCRPRNETCGYLFSKCTGVNHRIKCGDAVFCFECDQFPCKQLKRMDDRYRKNFGMSEIENLEYIRQHGIENFLEDQNQKHRCERCGGLIAVHNGKCFKCDEVTRLVEKVERR